MRCIELVWCRGESSAASLSGSRPRALEKRSGHLACGLAQCSALSLPAAPRSCTDVSRSVFAAAASWAAAVMHRVLFTLKGTSWGQGLGRLESFGCFRLSTDPDLSLSGQETPCHPTRSALPAGLYHLVLLICLCQCRMHAMLCAHAQPPLVPSVFQGFVHCTGHLVCQCAVHS